MIGAGNDGSIACPIFPVDSERFSDDFLRRFMRSRIHLRMSGFLTHELDFSKRDWEKLTEKC
jgi:hypothetical protein